MQLVAPTPPRPSRVRTVFKPLADLLLGLPGQRGVVLQQRRQSEVGGGQLPVDAVPNGHVAITASQQPHRSVVVVDGLQGETEDS